MNAYKPNHILVTGAAGFIGSNFVSTLMKNQDVEKIISLDKLTYASNLNALKIFDSYPSHYFVKGDICDAKLIENILAEHAIDTIVHFAAESHVDRSIDGPAEFINTNIVGTFRLLEVAKKYYEKMSLDETSFRFHHISTDEVYGSLDSDSPPFFEKMAYAPNSPYSASKAASDHLVQAYYQTYGLPVTVSHCSNNYGVYQHSEKLIPTVIKACKYLRPIPIYGDGLNIRDWLHVDDHVAAIYAILKKGRLGDTYNIGGNNELNNLALTKKICHLVDQLYPAEIARETLISFVKDRLGHDRRYAVDGGKIYQELGWKPAKPFNEGLSETIQYYWESS